MTRFLIVTMLIIFGFLTIIAIYNDGVLGIFNSITHTYGSFQIYVDLVIACILINIWIWKDAKLKNRNPWIWIIMTLLSGCFSPLIYLLTRK
ncbi:DUF2834 domain-containing protein [bacterium]|nr:DUF2834 domain-containing protein [bacterium]